MKLLMATNNKGKARELSAMLNSDKISVMTLSEAGYSIEVDEDGKTFAENARKKAVETYKKTHIPSIGDDSGLCVKALSGRPGIYSARWAGEGATGKQMIEKLFSELGDAPDREAEFRCAVALAFSEDDVIEAEGICRGVIADEEEGDGGFGYDPVFYVPERGKTFASMTAEEKNEISHRAVAIRALSEKLKERGVI